MNAHVFDVIRSARARAPLRRDSAFDDLGDSFWLGGEAQVAPNLLPAAAAPTTRLPDDDLDDPEWLVI